MIISAKVVASSISPAGYKIVSLKVCLPRIILPEFLTHREFSRSFVSNRALPPAAARELTGFVPLHWGKAQKGMQAMEEEIEGLARAHATEDWALALDAALFWSTGLEKQGVSKQNTNRLLEPFQWCVGVVTATSQTPGEWPMANFLGLRAKSAKVEPHMHELAWCMADAVHDLNVCRNWALLKPGEWHLPFIHESSDQIVAELGDGGQGAYEVAAMASAMRCARVSYNKLEGGTATIEEDAESARTKLMAPSDLHGSPFEAQARCPSEDNAHVRSGNFVGWYQFRQELPGQRSAFTEADYARGRIRILRDA